MSDVIISFYEVGYKNKDGVDIECKAYDSLDESCKAFNYLQEKSKQIEKNYAEAAIQPFIHMHDIKNIFNESDYDIKEIYNI